MTSRSKEKVAAAFRRLFRGSEKLDVPGSPTKGNKNIAGPAGASGSPSVASPSRRLLRCRDAVSPADFDFAGNQGQGAQHAGKVQHHLPVSSFFSKSKKKAAAAAAAAAAVVSASKASNVTPCVGASSANAEGSTHAKAVRVRRLMKELREIQRLQRSTERPSFSVELVNDNLFEWHVRLFAIDPESDLARDMRENGITYILLGLTFPDNFPFAPPFMRVVSPRIEKGFVMEGGAICMELLTPRGWASAYTVEAVVMQFAASIVKGQGRIARKPKGSKEFTRRSAEESFHSLVKTHEKYGWVTPPLADG